MRWAQSLSGTICALLVLAVFGAAGIAVPAEAQLTPVPPGNRNLEQPPIPAGAVSRTRATGGNFDEKYEKIRDLITENKVLQGKIKKTAELYGIAPIHIVGALVGEHTYNVDALDRLQTYLVKAAAYLGSELQFRYDGESVTQFVARPEFDSCAGLAESYDLWGCYEAVWDNTFKGKTVGGKQWPDDRFGRVFFQPLFAGQTFGLGQLNPLTALRVNDLVVETSRFPSLSAKRAPLVYQAIMNPDTTLHYMAAVIRIAIDAYADIAQFDISGNPGITATLYNLGNVRSKASILAAKRDALGSDVLPQENYYGWLVNDKLFELEPIIQ